MKNDIEIKLRKWFFKWIFDTFFSRFTNISNLKNNPDKANKIINYVKISMASFIIAMPFLHHGWLVFGAVSSFVTMLTYLVIYDKFIEDGIIKISKEHQERREYMNKTPIFTIAFIYAPILGICAILYSFLIK